MRVFLASVETCVSKLPAILAAVVATSLVFATPTVVEATCPDLFPKVTCFERIDTNIVTIYFGVDNFLNVSIIPAINIFDPNDFVVANSFDPGFTPRVLRITVDTTRFPIVRWFLGCQILVVDTPNLPDDLLCANPSPFLGCQPVTTPSSTHTATAACPVGLQVLTGGGRCDKHPSDGHGQLQASNPAPDLSSWQVGCKEGHATATAVCCPKP